MDRGGIVIHADEDIAYGVAGAVVILVARRRPTVTVARRADDALAQCAARQRGTFAYLAVIEPTSAPPDPGALAQLRTTVAAYPAMRAVAAVLEGRPPWMGAGVDIMIRIAGPQLRGRNAKICTDLREALVWLGRRPDPVLAPELVSDLESLVARLRAAMPPAS